MELPPPVSNFNFGFYSAWHEAAGMPCLLYKTIDGQEVKVTAVCNDIEGTDYHQSDKEFMGLITELVDQKIVDNWGDSILPYRVGSNHYRRFKELERERSYQEQIQDRLRLRRESVYQRQYREQDEQNRQERARQIATARRQLEEPLLDNNIQLNIPDDLAQRIRTAVEQARTSHSAVITSVQRSSRSEAAYPRIDFTQSMRELQEDD